MRTRVNRGYGRGLLLLYRHDRHETKTRRGVLVGGSSHAFVRDHNFRYGGVHCGYGGTARPRSGTGGLAEFRIILIPRTSVNKGKRKAGA
jgi:hypothetical protein